MYESEAGEGIGFVFGFGARGPVEGGGAGPRAPHKIGALEGTTREVRNVLFHMRSAISNCLGGKILISSPTLTSGAFTFTVRWELVMTHGP